MSRRKYDEKNHQVTWEDCEPWVQSLYEDHGVMVRSTVHLEGLQAGLKPAVRVTGCRYSSEGEIVDVFEEYRTFSLRSIGEVEKLTLHILSTALLSLENDKWRAEQGYGPLFAQ